MVYWALELKAFYAMPNPDGKTCRAFDLIYNGLEVSSGTQRIHVPSLLISRLKAKGLNSDNFKSYVDAFRYGAPHHAGWSIGLARLTMKIPDERTFGRPQCSLQTETESHLRPAKN